MPSSSSPCRRIAIDHPPAVLEALRAPLDDVRFDTRYLAPTHALHVHDYEGTIRIGRRRFELRRGDLTLSPAGVPSWYDLPRPGYHWVIHFRSDGGERHMNLPLHLSLGGRREFAVQRMAWIGQLLAQSRRPAAGSDLAAVQAAASLLELLVWIARVAAQPVVHPHRRADAAVGRAVMLLQERIARPLDVPALAAEVGVSQNHLARRFREQTGFAMPRYLLQQRIEHAKTLLRVTNLPIQRVGARVGLADPHHFNKHFRRVAGQSPSAYREQTMSG